MTRPITLDTLALAISSLRQKGPHPNLANDLAIDVVPVVRAMGEALMRAEEFIAGFEGDSMQEGVSQLLNDITHARLCFSTGRAAYQPTTSEAAA